MPMYTTFTTEITFLSPYRIVPWKKKEERKKCTAHIRGAKDAWWHRQDNGNNSNDDAWKREPGWPFITGRTVLKELTKQIELLLFKKGDPLGCCPGYILKHGHGNTPSVLEKKKGQIPHNDLCTQNTPCPLCQIKGTFLNLETVDGKTVKNAAMNEMTIELTQFVPPVGDAYLFQDIAFKRSVNRVNQSSGTARDYRDIWDIHPGILNRLTGIIFISHDGVKGGDDVLNKIRQLIAGGLAQINTLSGATCRVDITAIESIEDERLTHDRIRSIKSPAGYKYIQAGKKEKIETHHNDLIHELFECPTAITPSKFKPSKPFKKFDDKTYQPVFEKSAINPSDLAQRINDVLTPRQQPQHLRKIADKNRHFSSVTDFKPEMIPETTAGDKKTYWSQIPFKGDKTIKSMLTDACIQMDKIKPVERKTYLYECFFNELGNELHALCDTTSTQSMTTQHELVGIPENEGVITGNDDASISDRVLKKKPQFLHIFDGELTAVTPYFIGIDNGKNITRKKHVSQAIIRNADGSYRLPFSTLRGALRRDSEVVIVNDPNDTAHGDKDFCEKKPGETECDCKACMIMKNVVIEDSTSKTTLVPPEIRHTTRIDRSRGAAKHGDLKDSEAGYQGMKFPFRMYLDSENYLLNEHIKQVINTWITHVNLGGKRGSGYGCFRLNITNIQSFDYETKFAEILINRGFRGITFDIPEPDRIRQRINQFFPNSVSETHDIDFFNKIDYTLRLESMLLSRDFVTTVLDGDHPDVKMITKTVYSENGEKTVEPFIQSESVRGLLRSLLVWNGRASDMDHTDCDCVICRLFGKKQQQGLLCIEDLHILNMDQVKDVLIPHTAIDRITGGGINRFLFNEKPVAPDFSNKDSAIKLQGRILYHKSTTPEDLNCLAEAFECLKNNEAAIGGNSAIGYGFVTSLVVQGLPERPEAQSDSYTTIDCETDKPFISYNTGLPAIHATTDRIYWPYYYLYRPDQYIRKGRVQSPISHEQRDDTLYTGSLDCVLTTLGPVFTGGISKIDDESPSVKQDFSRVNNEIVINGSSIRGMVSSVYEALTGSCYRMMDQKKYLTRSIKPYGPEQKNVKAGRIIKDPNTGLYSIKPFKDIYRLPLYYDHNIWIGKNHTDYEDLIEKNLEENKKLERQEFIKLFKKALDSNKRLGKFSKYNREYLNKVKERQIDTNSQIMGDKDSIVGFIKAQNFFKEDKLALFFENRRHPSYSKGYIKYSGPCLVNVENITPQTAIPEGIPLFNKEDLEKIPEQILDKIMRMVHNNENKKGRNSQNYLYPRSEFKIRTEHVIYTCFVGCEYIFEINDAESPLPLSEDKVNRYNIIISENIKNTEHIPAFFKTHHRNEVLTDGDLVFYRTDENGNVQSVFPVAVPREFDQAPMGSRIPQLLRPCEWQSLDVEDCCEDVRDILPHHPRGLCPACHLFGTSFYRHRVSFGLARLENVPRWLISPEGTNSFKDGYLILPRQENPKMTFVMKESDGGPGSNGKADVPGVRFYIHHPHSVNELITNPVTADPYTRKIKALGQGNTFRFKVRFKNINAWELGLLIYALKLENGLAHKLGQGKALGFGSVRISVDQLRLRGGDEKSRKRGEADKKITEIKGFMDEGFDYLENDIGIKRNASYFNNLKRLLRLPAGDVQVRYPLLKKEGDAPSTLPDYRDIKRSWGTLMYIQAKLSVPWEPWAIMQDESWVVAGLSENAKKSFKKISYRYLLEKPGKISVTKNEHNNDVYSVVLDGKSYVIKKNVIKRCGLMDGDEIMLVQGQTVRFRTVTYSDGAEYARDIVLIGEDGNPVIS